MSVLTLDALALDNAEFHQCSGKAAWTVDASVYLYICKCICVFVIVFGMQGLTSGKVVQTVNS